MILGNNDKQSTNHHCSSQRPVDWGIAACIEILRKKPQAMGTYGASRLRFTKSSLSILCIPHKTISGLGGIKLSWKLVWTTTNVVQYFTIVGLSHAGVVHKDLHRFAPQLGIGSAGGLAVVPAWSSSQLICSRIISLEHVRMLLMICLLYEYVTKVSELEIL